MSETYYFNKKGQMVIVKDMPDAYLLNSYTAKKHELADLKSKAGEKGLLAFVDAEIKKLEGLIEVLKGEIERRKLME